MISGPKMRGAAATVPERVVYFRPWTIASMIGTYARFEMTR